MNKLLSYGGGMLLVVGVLLSGPAKADIVYQDKVAPYLQSIPGGLGTGTQMFDFVNAKPGSCQDGRG